MAKCAEDMMSDDEFDPKLYRDNPGAIAAYLDDIFRKNELREVLIALNRVMRAQNVKAIAREMGLRRDRLYKTFGGETDPQLGRVMAMPACRVDGRGASICRACRVQYSPIAKKRRGHESRSRLTRVEASCALFEGLGVRLSVMPGQNR
ncbi:hypothetical protein [Bradyrhizobium sp. JYMT SZCCT0428]|uniref:hypothetical protein n=1 Tax=Bradyrhizobium sp. JYMT SZCCT0428 TaxID=2807673 RepID=UPI003908AE3A